MIRKGINKNNFEYWKYSIYLSEHGVGKDIAELKAHRVCHKEEILMLKDRIIKLEKKLNKLTKKQ